MTENKPNRRELLEWINVVSFAVDDVKLFLDTHPCNSDALEYFEEFKKQRVQALREYAKFYGPLTLDTAHTPDCSVNAEYRPAGSRKFLLVGRLLQFQRRIGQTGKRQAA